MGTIDVFLSVRPSPAVDEVDGEGYFWIIVDALVDTNLIEEYISRSETARDLNFKFVDDTTDLHAVPLPDDLNIEIELGFASIASITCNLPRRDSYKFADRDAFVALNRSEPWITGRGDSMGDIDPKYDSSPAFRNQALRLLVSRAIQPGEDENFRNFLMRSSGLGASRLITKAVFDYDSMRDQIMLFDDGIADTYRTNQHSLDGQLVRCPVPSEDPTDITVTLTGTHFYQKVDLTVATLALAAQSHLTKFLKSSVRVPEITVVQNGVVANRLYAHARWEEGAKRPIVDARIGMISTFADVTVDPNSPCAGARGHGVLRIVAPDDAAKWNGSDYDYLNFIALRTVSGRLLPYRGSKGALATFEARGSSENSDQLFLAATLRAVLKADTGELLLLNQEPLPLTFIGRYNFPWEGSFDKPRPTAIFWSAKMTVKACDVVLVFDCGYGGGSLVRQTKMLAGEKGKRIYWQADDDDGGPVPEGANCIILTDDNGQPRIDVTDLSIQVLRMGSVDFELANTAARYEFRIDFMAYAPQWMPGSGSPVPKPGFGAFNTYSPEFTWQAFSASYPPFSIAADANANPISTDWPGDIKRTAFHLSLRQRLWDDPGSSKIADLANALYGSLGQHLSVVHVFQNPLGQSAEGTDGGSTFSFVACHFTTIARAASIRFNSSMGKDAQFWLLNFDDPKQELVLSANTEVLQDGGSIRASTWMAWKYVAELANAADLSLTVDLRYFDSSDIVSQLPAQPSATPVLKPFDFNTFDGVFSLNSYQSIFLDWLKNPPAAGITEVARIPLSLKGLKTPKISDVAHAMRAELLITRAEATLPTGAGGDHTLAVTYRPAFQVLDENPATRQTNDTALICAADQWLASLRSGASYLLPTGGQLLSLTALAKSQSDPAPEFFAPFKTPPLPAPGRTIASFLPIAARPIARHDQLGVLTSKVVDRLFGLLACTIDCAIPDWWARWTPSDWQVFFSYMPSRGGAATALDNIVEALIDMLASVPSAESQSDGAGALISMADGRLQEKDPRFRAQIRDFVWASLGEGHRISLGIFALMSETIGASLPVDLWQMSFSLAAADQEENLVKSTAAVTDVSQAAQLSNGVANTVFAVLSPLDRAKFRQGVTVQQVTVMRGAAATNTNAQGSQAFIEVLQVQLPGGNDTLKPSDPRVEIALPLLSQFVPPQLLSVARRQITSGEPGLFPAAGTPLSRRGLEASSVVGPQGAGDTTCIVIGVGRSAQQPVSRYDASIRVASFKIRLPEDAGTSPIAGAYFELLAQQPPPSDPSLAYQYDAFDLLQLLGGDTALAKMPQVADLQPQVTPYQFYADGDLAGILRVAQLYPNMDDQKLVGLRWERSTGGDWLPRFEMAPAVLWAEAALCQASGGGDEYYLSIVLQLPVWYQQPLWLRQARGLFALQKVGLPFVEHASIAVTGFESAIYACADYKNDPNLKGLPVPTVARDISVADLITALLVGDVIDPSEAWGQFEAKGLISHRMKPQLPTINSSGAWGTTPTIGGDTSYPLISIYSAPWSTGPIAFSGGHVDMTFDVAWFSFGSSSPFYETRGRQFKVESREEAWKAPIISKG
ncbi:hypothetical protein LMIY3S_03655 [Labrys miyagiensis]